MSGCRRAWRPFLAVLAILSFAACASREAPQYPPRSFFVFFPAGSAELTAEAGTVLDQIADEAKRINATAVGIVGYSSIAGLPAANVRLADERATAVETALALRQVPRAIIVRTSQGPVQDLAGPALAEQRVEVVVSRADR